MLSGTSNASGQPTRFGLRKSASVAENRPIAAPDLRTRQLDTPKWYKAQSPVFPLVDGLPGRLVESALRCAGNAVVPQVAQVYARAIKAAMNEADATIKRISDDRNETR